MAADTLEGQQEERRLQFATGVMNGLKALEPTRAAAVADYLEKQYGTTDLETLSYSDLVEANGFVGKVVNLDGVLGLLKK